MAGRVLRPPARRGARPGTRSVDRYTGTTNLTSGKAGDYAVFLADVVNHFRDVEGIDFGLVPGAWLFANGLVPIRRALEGRSQLAS